MTTSVTTTVTSSVTKPSDDSAMYEPFNFPLLVCLKKQYTVKVAAPLGGPIITVDRVPLSVLSADTLSVMCDAFRAAVFAAAQREDPKAGPR